MLHGDMGTAELRNRVVSEFGEDAVVQLGCPGTSDVRRLRWLPALIELVEKQPSQRFLEARVLRREFRAPKG